MLKDYKAVGLKQTEESASQSYTFVIKNKSIEEALVNAHNHIKYDHKAEASYHIDLELIGDSLIQLGNWPKRILAKQ